jgi:hypothetical protein
MTPTILNYPRFQCGSGQNDCYVDLISIVYLGLFLDLGSGDEKVKKMEAKKFLTPGYSTSGHVELYTVQPTVVFPH